MLFKSKKEVKAESKLILGMVILRDAIPLNLDLFLEDIEKNNKFKIGMTGMNCLYNLLK